MAKVLLFIVWEFSGMQLFEEVAYPQRLDDLAARGVISTVGN